MKANYIILCILLGTLLPAALPAVSLPVADYEKRITETYSITKDGRVKLDNRYGQIKVVTWDQPQVKIDVLIKVQARSKEDFERVLERIDVTLNSSGNLVSAVTTIESGDSGGWWKFITGGGSSSNDFKIYYTVSMPATVELETKARYCDVDLPNLSGATYLDVGYGDLVAGRLTGSAELDISYGSARVEEVGNDSRVKFRYSEGSVRRSGDVRYDGRYSEVRFGKVGDITLDIGYEEVEIESAGVVRMDGNYNELSVEQATSIYADGNYSDYDFGTVTEVLEVDGNYGDIDVDRLATGFKRVNIRVSYSDVDIDVDDSAGYTLDLRARYGDIDVPRNDLSPRNIQNEGSTSTVTGTKAGTGSGTIKIETNYGDIEIY